jgi:hypothetical protein
MDGSSEINRLCRFVDVLGEAAALNGGATGERAFQ